MNIKKIQDELKSIQSLNLLSLSDKQLEYFEFQSRNKKGVQPISFQLYNNSSERQTKLTIDQVNEIRTKYNHMVYGKKRLAKEYGVSPTLIKMIIRGVKWKNF